MSTISGGTGSLGYTPPEQTENGKETTANVLVAQMTLGISAKDEALFLLNAAGGRDAVFHYKSHPERPLLDKPLFTSRSVINYPGAGSPELNEITKQFLAALPEDLQTRFAEEMALPFEKRGLTFAAFSNFLNAASIALGVIQTASAPVIEGTQQDRMAALNAALPGNSLNGLKQNVVDIQEGFNTLIDAIDPTSLEHDQISQVKQDLAALLPEIDYAIANPGDQDAQQRISTALGKANDDFNHYSLGDTHPLLGSQLFAMGQIANVLPLVGIGLAPLQLNLALALHGGGDDGSTLPLFGEGVKQIAFSAINGLALEFLPKAGSAGTTLLTNALEAVLSGAYVLGKIASGNGLGVLPQGEGVDNQDIAKARAFEFALLSTFFIGTGGAKEVFGQIALQLGANPEEQGVIGGALQSLTALFLVEASPIDSAAARHMVLDAVQNSIASALDALDRAKKKEVLNGQLASETSVKTDIALQQALIAIQSGDYETFYTALDSLAESAGTNIAAVQTGVAPMSDFATTLTSGVSNASDDLNSAMTGITQQA